MKVKDKFFDNEANYYKFFKDSSAVLSISEIAVAVVIPVLFITCVVGVSIGVTCSWAMHRHKNKKEKYKEVTEPSLR